MPLYAANQALFFTEPYTPARWDGTSNITVIIRGYLDTANNAKRFLLRMAWEQYTAGTDLVPTTSHDVDIETLTGNWAQYQTFETQHIIDYDIDTPDVLVAGDSIALRIRRYAKTGAEDEIAGNVIVTSVHMKYRCDKFARGT